MRWQSGGRLLDVGCATGEFSARMAEHGWQVQGVEPSPQAAAVARETYGLDVAESSLTQARFPDRHFDAVTLWDVLEHVPDPLAELAEIHRVLKVGGVLAISLPNLRSFDAALFGQYWIGLDMPRHLHVIPPTLLESMLERCGFRVLSRGCSTGGYGAFLESVKFWLKDSRAAWPERLVAALAHGPALRILLLPYIYLSYALGRGPELAVTCRKTGA
jgi:SAM-dependent methyltransferase